MFDLDNSFHRILWEYTFSTKEALFCDASLMRDPLELDYAYNKGLV